MRVSNLCVSKRWSSWMGMLLACLLLFAASALAAEPVRAVSELDIDRYAGQWHEIAHLPVSFQKQCVGEITANYGLRRDGRISVTNACRKVDGERVVAEGVARPVAGQPGQLQVRLAGSQGSAMGRSLSQANCFIILEPQRPAIAAGEAVTIELFGAIFQ